VLKSDDEHFDIERVIKTRKRDGNEQYLLAWKGYPNKFDSWIDDLVAR